MIFIIDNLYVSVDTLNYTLVEKLNSVDKEGNPIYKSISHHDNLEKAIKYANQYMIKKKLQEDNRTLLEAIKVIKETNNEFINILNKELTDMEELK